MITKELLKSEIDKVQDKYLEALYQIIGAFEMPRRIETIAWPNSTAQGGELNWHEFIKATYGSLAEAPITRGEQGHNTRREEIL